MSSLTNKRVLLGITGGIAAYKSAELVRRLMERGAVVRVVMTDAAQAFITPLTLQALSGNPVHTEMMSTEAEAAMGHIELARWADLILIAPCSADFMARLVAGEANDLLSTVWLAHSGEKLVAPAMNQAMWAAPATQVNINVLKSRGVNVVGPATGEQACGDVGLGRMEEPSVIAEYSASLFKSELLAGKHVVITAGPTREAIDPVRYISNHSSGQMGYALAEAAAEAGACVSLISGPVHLDAPDRVSRICVNSAEDMHVAASELAAKADIFIGAAAVADYRVQHIAEQKIKKTSDTETLQLTLLKNPDIISDIATSYSQVFVVGFAAETQDVVAYAKRKLKSKNLDMIIANDVSDKSIGFNSENNAVTVIDSTQELQIDIQSKSSLARQLVQIIYSAYITKVASFALAQGNEVNQ